MKSQPVTVSARGWIDFTGLIDLDVSSEFHEILPSDSNPLREKITALIAQTGSIMNIKITGPLKDPKFHPLPSPMKIFKKATDLLLEGVKDAL